MGALTHAPKHSTSIQEQLLLSDNSDSFSEIFSLQASTSLFAPQIIHGVVVHTCTKNLPTGAKLYIV